MVYCGKPSRGCQNCKSRRIKCDEVRPSCTQCTKSSRVCPGYPDEFDLIFRNETSAVKKRAQRAFSSSSTKRSKKSSPLKLRPGQKASPTAESSGIGETGAASNASKKARLDNDSIPGTSSDRVSSSTIKSAFDCSTLMPLSALSTVSTNFNNITSADYLAWANGGGIPWSLPVPKDMSATSFFFQRHISWSKHEDSIRGFLEVLPSMYKNSAPGSFLHKAVYAVSLGTLSHARKSTPLLLEARREYGTALQELGVVIKSPASATSDETLMAILLFALYEQITWSHSARIAWTSHINGAVTLVKFRGQNQMGSMVSKRLFRAVRTLMINASLQLGAVFESFPETGSWTLDEGDDMNSANRLSIICLELPNVKHLAQEVLAKERTPETVLEITALIRKAIDIHFRLESWAHTLPEVWDAVVKKVVTEEPENVFQSEFWPGPVYVYRDLMIANILNDYRICRILCQSLVLRCIAALPSDAETDEMKRLSSQAVYVIQQMANEFSWSIPYLLGYDYASRPDSKPEDATASVVTGAYYALWPLFVTKQLPCIPERQREWLLGRLNYIGNNFWLHECRSKKSHGFKPKSGMMRK